VTSTNLTRDEAARRSSLLRVEAYRIDLDLTDGTGRPGDVTFHSRTEIRLSCSEPGADSFVDLNASGVRGAMLNGHPLDVSDYDKDVGLRLPNLAADNVVVVDADCRFTNTGEGLHRFVDPVDGEVYLYSQFETADAKRVFACFDQPDLKAIFTVTVTAPQHWEVVSNAPVDRVTAGPGGSKTVAFETTQRLSPYVTALVAGPYHVVRDVHDGIPLGIYCRQSLKQHLDADNLLRTTKQGFDWYHAQFGYRYPFGKYDQLFVPEFNAGAMENAGCVTILEDYVFRSKPVAYLVERRAETILHEMAHMWFGDLVTMRWWDDLWLNESFATFISFLCQDEATEGEWPRAWVAFENIEKSWGYRQDQLPTTHPIVADIPDVEAVEVNFDGITYAKGAAALRQLMVYVGRDAFMKGMQEYFRRYEFGNATLDDLLTVLEATSGRDLADWSRRWLRTAQVNTIRPRIVEAADGTLESVELLQEAPSDHPTLRPHRLAVGLYDLDGEGADAILGHRGTIELDVDGPVTEIPDLAGQRRPDLLLVNDGGLTYTKTRLDDRSLTTANAHLASLSDALARALCWQASWDMVRDAESRGRDYVTMALRALPLETASSGLLEALRNLRTALDRYTEPGWAATEGWPALAVTAHGMMRCAEPGGDSQLQWTRAFVTSARTDEQLDEIAGMLAGEVMVGGLTVDADLRWCLLDALVAAGRAGSAEIAAEADRDATATGHRQAATARALIPTPEAKAEAWQQVVSDDQLPNAIGEAIVRGFFHPTQAALTAPYAMAYFQVVDKVWERRSSEVAQTVAIGLYPSPHVSWDVVDAADAWLADASRSPALRRLVSEGRDATLRALRARARDAS
jgi:aminopeptidase N